MQYNFKEVEKKWASYFLNNKIFKKMNDNFRPRFFASNRYINPNKNLSISEYKSLLTTDAISRIKRMQGYNVLYSLAFNSFNMDAEKYAIKTSNNPFDYVKRNIKKVTDDLSNLGISFDNELTINSANKDFYKWSQWLFTKLHEKNLAKEREDYIYYCDILRRKVEEDEIYFDKIYKTKKEKYSVEKIPIKNWYIDLEPYNERILNSLDDSNYSDKLKSDIREAVGKKIGYNLKLRVDGTNLFFNSFTQRVDNLFGATFCVISPNNKYVYDITNGDEYNDVVEYINNSIDSKECNGVFTGSFIINPINGARLPIWVSNYFIDEYEKDFKICIPSCDILDYEFANLYGLDIIKVVDDDIIPNIFDGVHINSDFLNGLDNNSANKKAISYLKENGYGEEIITYKLKDICITKPYYFGPAMPLIYFNDETLKVLNSTELPLELPNIVVKETYEKTSPLFFAKDWINVYMDNKQGTRDINTLNHYADSSWFYLSFILKSNAGIIPINNPDAKLELNKWMPLNLYVSTNNDPLEVIYQKFMMYVLADLDYMKESEPYDTLLNIDEIDYELNYEEYINKYGYDVFRLFILNSNSNIDLIDFDVFRRFIDRLIRMFELDLNDGFISNKFNDLAITINNLYCEYNFSEIIKIMGEVINDILKNKELNKKEAVLILKLLNPIIPFVTEELYQEFITKKNILSFLEWPILE